LPAAIRTIRGVPVSIKVQEEKFTALQAAKAAGISRTTFWREIKAGKIGYYFIRGRKIYGASHITAYLTTAERPVA
jgi:predicted DNA-binding protein (UPF0251 family)